MTRCVPNQYTREVPLELKQQMGTQSPVVQHVSLANNPIAAVVAVAVCSIPERVRQTPLPCHTALSRSNPFRGTGGEDNTQHRSPWRPLWGLKELKLQTVPLLS